MGDQGLGLKVSLFAQYVREDGFWEGFSLREVSNSFLVSAANLSPQVQMLAVRRRALPRLLFL